jgi:hypothetical protein
MPPKKQDDKLPTADEFMEGGLRKMLKLKKGEKFKIGELAKVKKTKPGEMFDFRGKQYKMTPLMSKRVNLALNFLRLPKRKAAGEFAKKNKNKRNPKNPIDGDLLINAVALMLEQNRAAGNERLGLIPVVPHDSRNDALNHINRRAEGNGFVFQDFVNPNTYFSVTLRPNDNRTNILTNVHREAILEAAYDLDREGLLHSNE